MLIFSSLKFNYCILVKFLNDELTLSPLPSRSEAEFKEFEPRLKSKLRLKYGWFHIKLYSIFQDLSRRLIETGFWDMS